VYDKEIMAIANNTAKPTFQNTVPSIRNSGADLKRARYFFWYPTDQTQPTLQEAEFAPIFSATYVGNVILNSKLYKRFKAIDLNTLKGETKVNTILFARI
jgi:peptidyl-dipeptidase Dcp